MTELRHAAGVPATWVRRMLCLALGLAAPMLAADPGRDPAARPASPTPADLRSAALLISEQQGGALPMAVAAFRRPAGAEHHPAEPRVEVEVVVEVDGRAMLEALDEAKVAAEDPEAPAAEPAKRVVVVHAYALGDHLEVIAAASLSIPILEQDRQLLSSTGLRTRISLTPPPGEHRLRVLVRAGDRFGLRQQPLVIPGAEGPALFEPILPAVARWLESRLPGPAAETAPARSAPARAVATAGTALPAGFAYLGSTPTELAVHFEAVDPGPGAAPDPGSLSHALELDPADVTVEIRIPSEAQGLYRLRLVGEGTSASLPVEVLVVAPQGDGPAQELEPSSRSSWPALARRDPVAVASIAPLELPERTGRRLRRLRDEYIASLGTTATRGTEAGAEAAEAFEAAAWQALGPEAPALLQGVETRTATTLARRARRPGMILPVILTHLALPARHHAAGRSRLARHALDTTLALVRFYASFGDRQGQEAAVCLAVFAGDLQRRGDLSTAMTLFESALELAPREPAALLGLGVSAAWLGDLERAEALLEDYLEQREDDEIRLRLAVVRQRRAAKTGEGATDADRLLAALTESPIPWVACLAGQQWIRSALDRQDLVAARRRLESSRRRCADQPALAFAAAFLDERQGEDAAARRSLPGAGSASLRTRFNDWPRDIFEQRSAWLEARGERRRQSLARLLTELGSPDGQR